MMSTDRPGALVVSLDFELYWGARYTAAPDDPHLLGAREVVPRLLSLFETYGIAATWATVGFLFARSREDLERWRPERRPAYRNSRLDPYSEPVGEDEEDDPIRYARSLIERIRRTPRQEIGSHTYSHFLCMEPGQDAEAFAADLDTAVRVAREAGVEPNSIVFPRSQHNPAYDGIVRDAGFSCFRGNRASRLYRFRSSREESLPVRLGRLVDSYLPVTGPATIPWDRIRRPDGLCDIPGSFFIRPYTPALKSLEALRLRRVVAALERAAERREIVHVWWHPHNFGVDQEENLAFVESILKEFSRLREESGMISLTMAEVAGRAGELSAAHG